MSRISDINLNLTTPVQRRSFRKVLASLHAHRPRLLKMAARYPVMIDTPAGERFTVEGPEEVDEFIVAIELGLAAHAGASEPRPYQTSLAGCPCGCGASCAAQCWNTSDWADGSP